MDIEILQGFFFWCMLVNIGIYAFTTIAVLVLRDFVCTIHEKLFGLDEKTVFKSIQRYLATYKAIDNCFQLRTLDCNTDNQITCCN